MELTLTQKLKTHFASPETKNKLAQLDRDFSLTQKKIALADLVLVLTYGEIGIDDLPEIFIKLGFSQEKAFEFFRVLFNEVLKPVEKDLDARREEFFAIKRLNPEYEGVLGLSGSDKQSDVDKDFGRASPKALPAAREAREEKKTDEFLVDDVPEPVVLDATQEDLAPVITSLLSRAPAQVLTDDLLKKRLEQLTFVRFKNIKNRADARDLLLKNIKVGGLGMKEEEADSYLKEIDEMFSVYQKKQRDMIRKKNPNLSLKDPVVKREQAKEFSAAEKIKTEQNLLSREGWQTAPPLSGGVAALSAAPSSNTLNAQKVLREPTALPKETSHPAFAQNINQDTKILPDPDEKLLTAPELEVEAAPVNKTLIRYRTPDAHTKNASAFPKRVIKGSAQPEPMKPSPQRSVQAREDLAPLSSSPRMPDNAAAQVQQKDFPEKPKQDTVINKRLIRKNETLIPEKKIIPSPEKREVTQSAPAPVPKYEQKLVDLVEDLERMTLADFRALSENPHSACGKVREKIQLLEAERSFQGKINGIKAWQKSEPYQRYLALGREAMLAGKSVEQVIADSDKTEEVLNFEEFKAIGALNKQLSF